MAAAVVVVGGRLAAAYSHCPLPRAAAAAVVVDVDGGVQQPQLGMVAASLPAGCSGGRWIR